MRILENKQPHIGMNSDITENPEPQQQTIIFQIILDFSPQKKTGEENVLRHFGNLLVSGTGSDVQFVVKGEKIPAHSFIVDGGSPILAAMFKQSCWVESSSRIVIVEDMEPTVFRQLLHYLYTGDAPRIEKSDMTEPLFIAADKYQVGSLKDWCESINSKKIAVDSAIRLLILAHLHSAEKLKEDCIHFILKRKFEFFRMEEFRQMARDFPDLFFEVARRTSDL